MLYEINILGIFQKKKEKEKKFAKCKVQQISLKTLQKISNDEMICGKVDRGVFFLQNAMNILIYAIIFNFLQDPSTL